MAHDEDEDGARHGQTCESPAYYALRRADEIPTSSAGAIEPNRQYLCGCDQRDQETSRAAEGNREFTIDGRLVGDIGEIIAALEYDVVLYEISQPDHDGTTSAGRRVQIKAKFKDSLTFKTVPDYYLGFKLFPDGRHEEIFNGPGNVIYERYKHLKGIGTQLLSFPLKER